MGLVDGKERRSNPRFEPQERLEGQLFLQNTESVTVVIMNVSQDGLMLEVQEEIELEGRLKLEFLEIEMLISVVWCEKIDESESTYHCGCRVLEGPEPQEFLEAYGIDLEHI